MSLSPAFSQVPFMCCKATEDVPWAFSSRGQTALTLSVYLHKRDVPALWSIQWSHKLSILVAGCILFGIEEIRSRDCSQRTVHNPNENSNGGSIRISENSSATTAACLSYTLIHAAVFYCIWPCKMLPQWNFKQHFSSLDR